MDCPTVILGARLIIGIAFVTIAIELNILVWVLRQDLLFRRTILSAAMFVGFCGIARIIDFWALRDGQWLTRLPCTVAVADSVSALASLAFAVALLPLVLNALGFHVLQLDKL